VGEVDGAGLEDIIPSPELSPRSNRARQLWPSQFDYFGPADKLWRHGQPAERVENRACSESNPNGLISQRNTASNLAT